mmetsp:Transcript_106975/g.228413  ORF Transcript_106975/g.228413 Transcript_106975/m.228413 type:complete len:138 (+) Transcript_106975:22-435(+)
MYIHLETEKLAPHHEGHALNHRAEFGNIIAGGGAMPSESLSSESFNVALVGSARADRGGADKSVPAVSRVIKYFDVLSLLSAVGLCISSRLWRKTTFPGATAPFLFEVLCELAGGSTSLFMSRPVLYHCRSRLPSLP